jgi:hypothetical protein
MLEVLALEVTPYLQNRARARFEMEGDDVSGPWAPLTDATVAIRESAGFPGDHPINVRTGEMERFITGSRPTFAANPDAMMIFPGQDPVGKTYYKVQVAQKGTDVPPTPARPVIGIDEADLAYVLATIADEISLAT